MANTFGQSGSPLPLVDLRHLSEHRARFLRPEIPELTMANSLYCPAGRHPARGWILLTRESLNDIDDKYATDFQLDFTSYHGRTKTNRVFKNLAIVQSRCVTTGVAADENAVYLVELTDGRGLLKNRWFRRPTNSYYNMRSPAYPGDYYSRSLNAGAVWTWARMIQDLWEQMPELGVWPGTGLPTAPIGTPENWSLPGMCAWDALNEILYHLGLIVAADLTQDSPYTIADQGATDATFDDLATTWKTNLQDDLEWIDVGSGRVPGSVVVYFRTRYEVYGTEETVRRDALQWSMNVPYPVTVAAPATFTGAQGTHHLWDDFTVRLDVDGNALAADAAEAANRAAQRTTQFFADVYNGTTGFMHRTYAGVLPFAAAGQVDGVCWRQDYREGRQGFVTEVVRGWLWPEVCG